MVVRSQQPWWARQCPSECSGTDEEDRAHEWAPGELRNTCSTAEWKLCRFYILYPSLSLTAGHSRSSYSGHDLHSRGGQSLAGVQRLLQNVSETVHRRMTTGFLYCKYGKDLQWVMSVVRAPFHAQHCDHSRSTDGETAAGDDQGWDTDCVSRRRRQSLFPASGR